MAQALALTEERSLRNLNSHVTALAGYHVLTSWRRFTGR
jgi:hypothetical protein